jgi:diketogulonate reductase-like aldo/keto reductase
MSAQSKKVARVEENVALFDFELSEAEMTAIDQLGKEHNQRLCWKRDPLRNLEFE